MYYACCTSRGWATHRRRLSVLTQAQECSTKGWQQRREGRKHLSFVVILSFLVELQQNQLFFLAKYYQLLNRKLPIRHDLTHIKNKLDNYYLRWEGKMRDCDPSKSWNGAWGWEKSACGTDKSFRENWGIIQRYIKIYQREKLRIIKTKIMQSK